ncbi:hypothetical protein DFH09DRAFT_1337002 [Mycena vulgaris]|nr:hypothetical protein DFH09DRAFT_1337002 [Mycena vulgaris]
MTWACLAFSNLSRLTSTPSKLKISLLRIDNPRRNPFSRKVQPSGFQTILFAFYTIPVAVHTILVAICLQVLTHPLRYMSLSRVELNMADISPG